MPQPTKIFLSYARGDDEPFVRRLYEDLAGAGFDVWFDRVSLPSRQLSFHQEIKDAIRERERLIYVAGPQAALSDYVREEYRFALECDKAVIPILRKGDYDMVPSELCLIHCEDFRDDNQYSSQLKKLVDNLNRPEPPLGALFAVPNLPPHFQARPELLRRLKDAVLVDLQKPVVITSAASRVGVQGMGGIGKSVLAAAVARDREIRRSYPDGVIWISFGQNLDDAQLAQLMRDVALHLGDPGLFENVAQGKGVLRNLLLTRSVLLVLDNVWKAKDAQAFDVLGPRCRALVTTRDAGILDTLHGEIYPVNLFTEAEALSLLAAAVEKTPDQLPAEAREVVRECGCLPLAVALCGGMARKRDGNWENILKRLRHADLEKIGDREAIEEQHISLYRAMQASVEVLDPEQQKRFEELSVFVTDQTIPQAAVARLWKQSGNLDDLDAEDLLIDLCERALIRLDRDEAKPDGQSRRRVSLHDLLYDFAVRAADAPQVLNQTLLDAYHKDCSDGWHSGPDDGYFFRNLCHHLVNANGNWDEAAELLCDLRFVDVRCRIGETYDLVRDYRLALDEIPERQAEREKEKEHEQSIQKYISDLIAYARGEIKKLHIIPAVQSWSEQQVKEHIERMRTRPTRTDRLQDFLNFLGQEAGNLRQYASQLHGFAIQQAWNHADSGPVGDAASDVVGKKTWAGQNHLLLRKTPTRPTWNALPQAIKTLKGQPDMVTAVSVTPDAKRAISSSFKTCILWDLDTGQPIKTLIGHIHIVNTVSVTPDGKRAISGSSDNTCILWDLDAGQPIKTLKGHTGPVRAVSVTPDGKRAISGSWDNTCILWDLDTGQPIKTLKGHANEVRAVNVTPDAKRAVSGSEDNTCILWDLDTGQPIKTLKGHTGPVWAVSVTPDGKRAISGSVDKTCILWDLDTGQPIKTLKGHTGPVEAVSVTPDSKRAISGSWDHTCILWDLDTGQPIKTLKGHTRGVAAVSVAPDAKRAISGSYDNTCILWDLDTGQPIKTLNGHTEYVWAVSVTPDGKRAVSGSEDNTCILWDLDTGQPIKTLKGHTGPVRAVSVTPDGKRAISGSYDNTCILWDLDTGQPIKTLKGHANEVWAVSVTPDGKRAISGSYDNTCILWDLDTGQPIKTLKGHTVYVRAVSVTPDAKRAISGSEDNTCILWDLDTGQPIKTLKGHTSYVRAVSVTPDGKRAISGSDDNTCILWDLDTGQPIKTLIGHTGPVEAVSVTPDAKRAISGSDDNTCILWDLDTGQPIKTLKGHTNWVLAVSVTPDGKHAISGSWDNTCILWDLDTGSALARFIGKSPVRCAALYPAGVFVGMDSGEIAILPASRESLCPEPGMATVRHIWDFDLHHYLDLSADCPFCGARFAPEKIILETIRAIYRSSGLGPNDSPCLSLPRECWEEPRLLSTCPKCKEALHFNPFIVDPGGLVCKVRITHAEL